MPRFSGNRQFVWFETEGRRATQYECYSVGQQSSPAQWLHVDWPLRFDDGRAPYALESTALRCRNWSAYRDPTRTWQRPYVAQHNHVAQAMDSLVPVLASTGLLERMAPAWRDRVLGVYYAAWPFVEYGQFLSLCYSVREALADTLTFALAFAASDKIRHGQDIVYLLLTLEESCPGFSDAGARAAWLGDPALVPLRETIERIYSSRDWAEIALALHLVLEPLAGELFKTEFLARLAPLNGDPLTPILVASARRDNQRALEATQALVRLVLADPEHGPDNRVLVEGWVSKWTGHALAATRALGVLFELDGIASLPFEPHYAAVVARQRELLTQCGLAADGPP